MPRPNFFTSEYFVPEPDNWHLKEGAPQEVKEEFEEYMNMREKAKMNGIIID